jgi:hypothetical protein
VLFVRARWLHPSVNFPLDFASRFKKTSVI